MTAPGEFQAVNPATGRPGHAEPALTAEQQDALLARLVAQQRPWRTTPVPERARFARALAEALEAAREPLARAVTDDMGKPLAEARGEVAKCRVLCEVIPALAEEALAPRALLDDHTGGAELVHEPLGIILAIMPWNFPHWQALRAALPALLAGNGVLIKPAPGVPGAARALGDVLVRANAVLEAEGLPPAPVAVACLPREALDGCIADPRIAGVTLTGSTTAGRQVAAVAGAHLKPVVLELGGSDPFVVLPDADVARAAQVAAASRTMNAGQSCIAAKRMIVCEAVYPAFRDAFCQAMAERQPGDPLDPASRMGPLASPGARARLGAQVVRATAAGARLLLGGAPGDAPGCAFPPTVLEADHAGVLAPDEECFGPVAVLLKVADEAAAIAAANATAYGLGASVWSADLPAARRVAAALDAGMVTINDMTVSDPRLPFGGIKASGLGRELGALGVLAFTNPKVIRWVHPPASPR